MAERVLKTVRIAVDARPLATPHNGIGRYLSSLLPLLTKSSHEWLLYSDRPVPLPTGTTVLALREGRVGRRWLSTFYAQCRFGSLARRDEADLFWSPRHHLPLLSRMPAVVTIHDMVWRKVPETMISLGRTAERLLMPQAIRRTESILVPSQATAEDIREYCPQAAPKIRVIPLAASLPAANRTANDGPPYILFVGTLEPRKNLARAIDAFCRLIEEADSTPHQLLIAGNVGWKNDHIQRRLRTSPARHRIRYLGPMSDQQLANLYSNADFLIAPSLYEGFGLQVLEGLSFGLPVITSGVASLPEVAGDAAILVDPCSVDAISDAMGRLIEDRALHADLSAKARVRATRFSWEQTAAATLRALEEAADRHGA